MSVSSPTRRELARRRASHLDARSHEYDSVSPLGWYAVSSVYNGGFNPLVFLRAVRRPGPARARARSRAHRCSLVLVARVHVRRPSRHTLPRHSRARSCARDCASARLGRGSGVRGTHGPRTSRETKTHAPFGGLAGTHLVSAHTQTHQTPELTNTTRHHDKAKTASQGARAPGTYTPPINRVDRTLRRPPEELSA